ncbi:heme exporter protein D [Azospirillaceae bacterium]
MSEFLHMGGYAIYVWPAYGFGIIIMVGLATFSVKNLRKNRSLLRMLENARPTRRSSPTTIAP